MDDLQKRADAEAALDFLREHPALNNGGGDSLVDGMCFMMQKCCKHNQSESCGKYGVKIYHDEYQKYKDIFDEEYKDMSEEEEPLKFRCIDVPYERMYGEPWQYDHMEYWYELTFFVFEGNPYSFDESCDFKNYERCSGPHGGANTFEDMLIDAATTVKALFGDYNRWEGSLYLPEEIACRRATEPFTAEDIPGSLFKRMIFNKENVDVNDGLINLRWLGKMIDTDYIKKNWEYYRNQWKTHINKIKDLEPQSRKDILAKYKV